MLYDPTKDKLKPKTHVPKRGVLSTRDRRYLQAAINRISDPQKWWNGGPMRLTVDPNKQHCAYTSLTVDTPYASIQRIKAAMERVMGGRIARFNDSHTHAEVIAAMRETMELL